MTDDTAPVDGRSDDEPVEAGGSAGAAASAGPAASTGEDVEEIVGSTGRRLQGKELVLALIFLVPALFMLGVWLVYPVLFTVWRSFFDAGGDFAGIDNYREMFDRGSTRTAIRNNFIWVVFAPTLAAAIGLVFAVLTERIRFGTAFKLIIFMPMAISFLAAGVIFRFVYDEDPNRGLANALLTTVTDLWQEPGPLVGANPSVESFAAEGRRIVSVEPLSAGDTAQIGVVGIPPDSVGDAEAAAAPPEPGPDEITGTVWLDFTRGGGGERGALDEGERAMSGVEVAVLDQSGRRVGSATTADDGTFSIAGVPDGPLTVALPPSNFDEPWTGFRFLGETLVTPAVIGSFLWIWAGFAMVVIAAGLAAIPRETMEAARVDGANEWQVFRRVTVPLLLPVILVVIVTLVINVLKIFDLVLIVPPGSVQDDANVIALELWKVSFGAGDEGLGSALGVLLFLLVLPAMAFNIRRFRAEGS